MKKLLIITFAVTLIFSLFSCDTNLFSKEEYTEPKPVGSPVNDFLQVLKMEELLK